MHESKTNKPGRTSAILILSLLVLTFLWVVLSRWFLPNLIQRAYYGQSLPAAEIRDSHQTPTPAFSG